jgi:hypothetical protein
MWGSFAAPIGSGIAALASAAGLVASLSVLGILYLGRGSSDEGAMTRRSAARFVAAGLLLLVLALLPYLFVGKMPGLADFSSRHQLLVPFGAAMILGGLLRLGAGPSARRTLGMLAAAAMLLGGFTVATIDNNLSYLRERYKQIAMMEAMRVTPEFRSATTFTFIDRTPDLNANRRTSIRDYEYAGMMAQAFGDQTRFGADADEFERRGMAGFRGRFTSLYKMGGYMEGSVQYRVEVLPGPLGIDRDRVVLRLLAVDLFDPSGLPGAVVGAVSLRLLPVASD